MNWREIKQSIIFGLLTGGILAYLIALIILTNIND